MVFIVVKEHSTFHTYRPFQTKFMAAFDRGNKTVRHGVYMIRSEDDLTLQRDDIVGLCTIFLTGLYSIYLAAAFIVDMKYN